MRDIFLITAAIWKRELIGFLRSRRAWLITALIVGAAGLFPLGYWPEEGNPLAYRNAIKAFEAFELVFLIATAIFVPPLAASSITREREKGTYDVLATTISRPSGIILGKLLASTVYFFLLLALAFPIICVLFLIGGFQIGDFLLLAAGLGTSILALAILGLMCSQVCRKTHRAILLTYLCIFLLAIFILLSSGTGVILMPLALIIAFSILFSDIRHLEPPPAMAAGPSSNREGSSGRATVPPTPAANLGAWINRRFLGIPRSGIPDGWNPVFVMTIQRRAQGSLNVVFMIAAIILGVLSSLALLLTIGERDVYLILGFAFAGASIAMLMAAIGLPASAAMSLQEEKLPGIFEALQSTILAPETVFWGKFFAGVFEGLKFYLIIATYLVFHIILRGKPLDLELLFLSVFMPAVVCALCVGAGILGGAAGRSAPEALLIAYLGAFTSLWLLISSLKVLGPVIPFLGALSAFPLEAALAGALFKKKWRQDG
jgi:ABC-type transport system involved in multi-copper enzyme maturation permease subunit